MRKILDIIPPKGGETARAVSSADEVRGSASKKKGRIPKLAVLLIGAGLVLVASLAYIFVEPKAKIEIWPVKDRIELQTEADSIPAEVFKIEKDLSQEFAATGTKLKADKSHGTIRIYNDYSPSPQILISVTRFISSEGKLFRIPAKVTVPGMPGTVDVEVVADQPGEEYNIGPSTFSIPGFAGTPKYTSFYAKSFEPMAGGIKKEVTQVLQEDLDKAEKALNEKALRECKSSLMAMVPSENYVLMEGAEECQIKNFSSSAKAGQEADKFLSQIRVEGKILAFKKSDLVGFTKNYAGSRVPSGKELYVNSLETEYDPKTIDLKTGKMVLSLKISGEIFSTPDRDHLKETIKNKALGEARTIVGGISEITSARVRLWPFWARKIPSGAERINIEIRLD